ncbi:hypothetical protein ACFQH6_04765 [Halobacteriaceae archaeon GCM10025711]
MAEPSTLVDRLKADLYSLQSVVILTAVLVAVPAAMLWMAPSYGFEAGFLLLMLVGVDVPALYDREWPVAYGSAGVVVAWTLVACLLVGVTFVALVVLARAAGLGPLWSASLAFVATWLGSVGGARTLGARLSG